MSITSCIRTFTSVVVFAVPVLAQSLGSVRLPQRVMADGKPLAAGTYTVRISSDAVTPVVGQGPNSEKWVEFLQGTEVKGRELATVVSGPDVKAVAKGELPATGAARVQVLRGADYLRVWINSDGTQYLVHLGTK